MKILRPGSKVDVALARKSVFLAGPTPRQKDIDSWRPEAIEIFRGRLQFTGTLLVPEPFIDFHKNPKYNYSCVLFAIYY